MIQDPLLLFNWQLVVQAFVTLFAIFDPIGILPFYATLMEGVKETSRNKIINTSCIVSLAILLLFAYGGVYLFQVLNITLNDFKVFGGLILLIFAITYVLGRDPHKYLPEHKEEIAIFPLATPLLAGPGSISLVMILVNPPFGPVTALLVIVLTVLLTWIILRLGVRLNKILGKQGSAVISRIMGLIIGAVAFSFIREGLFEIIRQFIVAG